MSLVFDALPDEAALRQACRDAGGSDWHWSAGALADAGLNGRYFTTFQFKRDRRFTDRLAPAPPSVPG